MYSLEKPIGDMKMIVDCVYLAAMNTRGGQERHSNRLVEALLHLQCALPPSCHHNIFGQLVVGRFSADVFSPQVVDVVSKLVPVTVDRGTRFSQDASDACQVPLPVQHARAQQGVPRFDPRRARQVRENNRLSSSGGKVKSLEAYLVALWRHEASELCDKLTTHEDKDWEISSS